MLSITVTGSIAKRTVINEKDDPNVMYFELRCKIFDGQGKQDDLVCDIYVPKYLEKSAARLITNGRYVGVQASVMRPTGYSMTDGRHEYRVAIKAERLFIL